MPAFANNDDRLRERVDQTLEERRKAGLEGLVGGLEAVVINTEPERQKEAVQELLDRTGLSYRGAFQDGRFATCVLKHEGSADFLVRSRQGDNPFAPFNQGAKSRLPNTRLETFIYRCNDLERYAALQKARGVTFLTEDIQDFDGYSFIQTPPSLFTGNSTGFIQWRDNEGEYITEDSEILDWMFEKPKRPYLENIHELDHTATRVRAEHRDDAIIEFMRLTEYCFDFAVYVESLNSITNVARLTPDDYAQVFTSGITPFADLESSGPTERFIHNYGLRVHHMAFRTEDIEHVHGELIKDGLGFLIELVGSPEEGLKQTFTQMSPNTYLVNEYIHRYDGFDGFFTKSNVTDLTRATEKQ